MKTNYIVNIAGLNVDKKAMNRLIVLSKKWKNNTCTIGTKENKEAKELLKKGCFFVDGTSYTKKFFTEQIGPCDCKVGQTLPQLLIP